MSNDGAKKLVIDIEPVLHKEIKLASVVRGVSLRQWVTWAIQAALLKEKQLLNLKDLE